MGEFDTSIFQEIQCLKKAQATQLTDNIENNVEGTLRVYREFKS